MADPELTIYLVAGIVNAGVFLIYVLVMKRGLSTGPIHPDSATTSAFCGGCGHALAGGRFCGACGKPAEAQNA